MIPFLILASERTGSQYLESLLNSHPDCICFGEIFHPDERHREIMQRRLPPEFACHMATWNVNPERFLREGVWRSVQPKRHVGFRLFYVHIQEYPNPNELLRTVRAYKNLRVLHLVRENALEQFVSLRLAFLTGVWRRAASNSDTGAPQTAIVIEPRELEEFFVCREDQRREISAHFADMPFKTFYYEELGEDPGGVAGEVSDFLGLPPKKLHSELRKQEVRTMPEAVANYAALKTHFCDTAWRKYFE